MTRSVSGYNPCLNAVIWTKEDVYTKVLCTDCVGLNQSTLQVSPTSSKWNGGCFVGVPVILKLRYYPISQSRDSRAMHDFRDDW